MNRIKKYILSFFISIQVISCTDSKINKAKIFWNVHGPFSQEQIKKEFGLDSITGGMHRDHYFILSIENNHNIVKTIKTSRQHEIIPYSSHLHSFSPFSSEERCWQTYDYSSLKHDAYPIDSMLLKGKKSKFWFNTMYDKYADTLYAHFEFEDLESDEISQRTFWKTFEPEDKPQINYQFTEANKSIKQNEENDFSIILNGPFTYAAANKLLKTNIKYKIDSEEVFIAEIKNDGMDTIYIETWQDNEIQLDTIYSFIKSTQRSIDKQWDIITYNKSEPPFDTVTIAPSRSKTFWFYFTFLNPEIDSFAFQKTVKKEEYNSIVMQLYSVEKLKN